MFTNLRQPAFRLLPAVPLLRWLRLKRTAHQNRLYPEEMSEALKRDLGLIDGRTPRGAPNEGGSRLAGMIYTQRSL